MIAFDEQPWVSYDLFTDNEPDSTILMIIEFYITCEFFMWQKIEIQYNSAVSNFYGKKL